MKNKGKEINSPAHIVMQWLTYAFWSWTAISILIMSAMIFSYYILKSDVSSSIPYAIAAVAVLMPVSIVCDFFYRKYEPVKKTGIASIIMIIHAVIFALSCVGALVVIVLNIVKILIESSDTLINQVSIYSSLVVLLVCAILFIRVIAPEKVFKYRWVVSIDISTIAIILVVFGFIGPVANSIKTKNDKLIESSLSAVVDSVSYYVDVNNKLPNSLQDLKLSNNSYSSPKKLVSDNLVTYKKIDEVVDIVDADVEGKDIYSIGKGLKYQLCVIYIEEKLGNAYDGGYFRSPSMYANEEYSPYVDTYNHPAGEFCYKISV